MMAATTPNNTAAKRPSEMKESLGAAGRSASRLCFALAVAAAVTTDHKRHSEAHNQATCCVGGWIELRSRIDAVAPAALTKKTSPTHPPPRGSRRAPTALSKAPAS